MIRIVSGEVTDSESWLKVFDCSHITERLLAGVCGDGSDTSEEKRLDP